MERFYSVSSGGSGSGSTGDQTNQNTDQQQQDNQQTQQPQQPQQGQQYGYQFNWVQNGQTMGGYWQWDITTGTGSGSDNYGSFNLVWGTDSNGNTIATLTYADGTVRQWNFGSGWSWTSGASFSGSVNIDGSSYQGKSFHHLYTLS